MLILLVLLVVMGLVLGALARLAVPGPDPMPIWLTILIGIGGSIIGGLVGQVLFGRPGGLFLAFLASVGLVIAYRHFFQGRGITGPSARSLPRRRL
jgi:uncharacterized membrane protein YeaQ/YmgE (transglycosylase-associated protein family)